MKRTVTSESSVSTQSSKNSAPKGEGKSLSNNPTCISSSISSAFSERTVNKYSSALCTESQQPYLEQRHWTGPRCLRSRCLLLETSVRDLGVSPERHLCTEGIGLQGGCMGPDLWTEVSSLLLISRCKTSVLWFLHLSEKCNNSSFTGILRIEELRVK